MRVLEPLLLVATLLVLATCNSTTPLTCYSCNEKDSSDCKDVNTTTTPTVTCHPPNECYARVYNGSVERGCGVFNTCCVVEPEVLQTSFCGYEMCNDDFGTITYITCYHCNSEGNSDCGSPFKPDKVPTVKCDNKYYYCYVDRRAGVTERGCTWFREYGVEYCSKDKCNDCAVHLISVLCVLISFINMVIYM